MNLPSSLGVAEISRVVRTHDDLPSHLARVRACVSAKRDRAGSRKRLENLYVCFRCGRIINQDTLALVGRNPPPKLLDLE